MTRFEKVHVYNPPLWRLLLSFLIAPLVPITPLAVTGAVFMKTDLFAIIFIGFIAASYLLAFFIGLPAYLLLRRLAKLSLLHVSIVTGLITVVPVVVSLLMDDIKFVPPPLALWPLVNDGIRIVLGFFLGMLTGLVFWLLGIYEPRHSPWHITSLERGLR